MSEDILIINNYYKDKIDPRKEDYLIHGWESKEAAEKRLKQLFDHLDLVGKSIIDIGCGVGSLLSLIKKNQINTKYLGVDILPDMIKLAKARHPEGNFLHLDIFKENFFKEGSFDFVYSSGIFNLKLTNNEAFVQEAFILFNFLAKEKIMVNFLHENSNNREERYFYTNPEKIFKLIEKTGILYKDISVKENYLANDFSMVITKRV
ncbi:MAG: class I SAM-dependent methyltransferase [Spirochaetales bacterium]|nr:class I SAM-dependent methyltransferase [Spirochaetales bacterium]